MTKTLYHDTVWVIVFHSNDMYHDIVSFALNKVFMHT